MKKILAITLLALINAALSFVMYVLVVMSLFSVIVAPLILFLFAAHIFAAAVVQSKLEKHRVLGKPAFWLCSGFPGLAASVLICAVGLSRDTGDGMGFPALYLYFPIYAGAFFGALGLVLLIKHLINRNRPQKEKI